MPINLKEILVNDTNQIRIDKINYNFDQIIALGGQKGPIGVQGVIGPAGPTGAQGVQGPIGPSGSNGTDGQAAPGQWTAIDHATVTGEVNDYDVKIIKPNLFGKDQPTSVYIGDPVFNDATPTDGDDTARASLVVGKSDPFENNIKLTTDGSPHTLVIRGDENTIYGGAIYHIQKGDIIDSLRTKLEISFDDVDINATSNNNASGIITMSSKKTLIVAPDLGFNTDVGTKSYFNDRVEVIEADLLVNGSGFTRISRGTTDDKDNIAESDLSGGNIRYNSTTNQYEVYYENTADGSKWLDLRRITDADEDTYISLPLNNDNDSIEFVSKDIRFLRIGGDQLSLKAQSDASTTVPTIEADKTIFTKENLHIIGDGKGLSFKEGPAVTNATSSTGGSAINFDTPISDRTMSDFFYRAPGFFELENVVEPGDILTDNVNDQTQFPGITSDDDPILTNEIFMYDIDDISGLVEGGDETSGLQLAASAADEGAVSSDPAGRLITVINRSSEVSYQKVGNMVHVNVRLVWKPFIFDDQTDGSNYDPYPGTYFQTTFGVSEDQSKYWNDSNIQDAPIYLNIPEMYRRLPSANSEAISDFLHDGLDLSNISGATDRQTKISLKKGNGYCQILSRPITGGGTTIKVSDVADNTLAIGNWIYSNFNFTYLCEDKKTWQANIPFNENTSSGGGGVIPGGLIRE